MLRFAGRRWRKSWLDAATRAERTAFYTALRDVEYDAVLDIQGLFTVTLSELQDLSRGTLPEQFGATYRHFLRVVKKLCEEGAIEKQGKLYRIKDRSALERKVYE